MVSASRRTCQLPHTSRLRSFHRESDRRHLWNESKQSCSVFSLHALCATPCHHLHSLRQSSLTSTRIRRRQRYRLRRSSIEDRTCQYCITSQVSSDIATYLTASGPFLPTGPAHQTASISQPYRRMSTVNTKMISWTSGRHEANGRSEHCRTRIALALATSEVRSRACPRRWVSDVERRKRGSRVPDTLRFLQEYVGGLHP